MENFEFIDSIDEGAFGVVQKARNKKTGEIVAIKKIKKKYTNWDECMNLREIRSLRKLKHPNIIKLKEVFKQENTLYMVFEYAEKDLFKLYLHNFKNTGIKMPENEIRNLIFQITKGLAHMHKNGYFHRDLKPENILVTNNGSVKIADLGLAREIRSSPPYTDYVSTRWYRAPEILLKSSTYNSPVDIFSLGCIMAELYLQQPLFNGNSEIDQLQKICKVLGTPGRQWQEGHKLARQLGFEFPINDPIPLKDILISASSEAIDLLISMLKFDNSKRITANKMLNHPYFANCLSGYSDKDDTTIEYDFFNFNKERKNNNQIIKSDDTLSDDIDQLVNEERFNNSRENLSKSKTKQNKNAGQVLNKLNSFDEKDKLDYDLLDKLYPESNTVNSNYKKYTPKLKLDSFERLSQYNSPKRNNNGANTYDEGSSAMKINTKNILNRTATPKKESAFNAYKSEICDSVINQCRSVKDNKDMIFINHNKPLSFSNNKRNYNESVNNRRLDNNETISMKEKNISGFRTNLDAIDDQIDELLNSSNKKVSNTRDVDKYDDSSSYGSNLLKYPPGEAKITHNIYNKLEKENYKTIQGPSYLNGITMLQNFEKTSFN